MSTNITKLKSRKGAPPPVDEAPEVISQDLRETQQPQQSPQPQSPRKSREPRKPQDAGEPLRPLQLRVPQSVFEGFSERAGREFGFTHGAKKQLFLKMWKAYEKRGA